MNSKIPQSTSMMQHRKISGLAIDKLSQHIYYQEGNFDAESVNNLTDIQDPSVESSSNKFFHHNEIIDHILNDDEEENSIISSHN